MSARRNEVDGSRKGPAGRSQTVAIFLPGTHQHEVQTAAQASMLKAVIKNEHINITPLLRILGCLDTISSGENNAREISGQHGGFISDLVRCCLRTSVRAKLADWRHPGIQPFVTSRKDADSVLSGLQHPGEPEDERCFPRPAKQ